MKKTKKILEIVAYIMGAQITVCAILDVLHITDFIEYKWYAIERYTFVVIFILAAIFSTKKD